jgi:precorrin-3B C17-methyltransferase
MLYVVGIGSGSKENMTQEAKNAMENADVLVGYTTYIDLIRPLFPKKRVVSTAMTQEVERCKSALALAENGERVAVICSGDAGVYGMAGLIFELSVEYPNVDIEIVSGVTAALSGAATLGSPINHDFAAISLSDLLTPRSVIEKRLDCAAQGDFCVALYNPSSKKRSDCLAKACEILLRHKSADTVCGIARNVGRAGRSSRVLTLAELKDTAVDMFTTVFVGNAQTKIINGKMVTPRGYAL